MNSKWYAMSAGKYCSYQHFERSYYLHIQCQVGQEEKSVLVHQINFWWKTLNQMAQRVPKQGMLYMYIQQNSVCGNLCHTL